MKFSYSWLQSFFSKKLPSPKELANLLTLHSFEVESVQKDQQDWVLDIDILPNRPDCLSYRGLAQEIATLLNWKIKKEDEIKIEPKEKNIAKFISINVKDANLCPRYFAALVTNIKIKSSPSWLQKKLRINGIQPINNVVDITNYVMLETGQPLHAFDFDKINSQKIGKNNGKDIKILNVRRAKKQEVFISLDQKQFKLTDSMLVIADSKDVLALAGIKGGKKAEITLETKNILLEGANFDSLSIRKTSHLLNLFTDASFRFSYGQDPNVVEFAIKKALKMIKELAGGEFEAFYDFYPQRVFPKKIKLDFDKVRRLLGVNISNKEIYQILKRLNFKVLPSRLVEIPTSRSEIDIQESLITEIGRIYGFWRILPVFPSRPMVTVEKNESLIWENKLKQALKEAGFDEIMSYSFCATEDIKNFYFEDNEVAEILNPVSLNFRYLRPTLLIGLLKNLSFNQKHFSNIKIFEIGKIFRKIKNQFTEKKMIGALIFPSDFFALKGTVDFIFNRLGIPGVWYDSFEATSEDSKQNIWHKSKIAEIKLNHQEVGFLGEISPLLLEKYGIKENVCAFELDFEKLKKFATEEMEYEEISPYPAAIRDISVIVPLNVKVDEVLTQIQFLSPLIRDVDLFDIFEGVEEGKKSLSFHIIFQSKNKTLSDKELDVLQKKIIENLEKNPGWKVRKK